MNRYRVSGFVYQLRRISWASIILLVATQHSNAQPAKGYDVISYDATVRLDRQTDSIFGEVTMTARADSAIASILQHAKFLTTDSIIVNGLRASVSWQDTAMGVFYDIPPNQLQAGTTFTVHTYYHGPGKPEQNAAAWGGVTDADTMMFAMGVGFANPYTSCTRHWLPCYDLPDDKADSVDLTFITKPGDITASNGTLISNLLTPQAERIMHWHVGHPIATYLLTFATGPYTLQEIPNAVGKPFEVFALARDSSKVATLMHARVREALEFYDSLFVPYPHEKVGYVVTPIGSMEHQTMISLAKQVLDTSRNDAVHELSHQWWGDWVTCKTFDDAWLNEGFARYCESLFIERFFGKNKYYQAQSGNVKSEYSVRAKHLFIDTLPVFGAATADHHTNNYPGTIYTKGAVILGMLRDYIGDSLFFVALRNYGKAHAYSTVQTPDLQAAFEQTSGGPLGWFFTQFVYDRGMPNISVSWNKVSNGASIQFTQWQDTLGFRFFGMPVLVRGAAGAQSKSIYVWMDSTKTSSTMANFGFVPDTVTINPLGDLLLRVDKSSEVAGVNATKGPDASFLIYPNPSHHSIRFTLASPLTTERCQMTIYDVEGRIVRHMSFDTVGTVLQEEIDLMGLAAGVYTISVESLNGLHANQSFTLEP